MKYLCLDPSLRAFGWAVIEDDDFIDGGCIVTKSDKGKSITQSDLDSLTIITNELQLVINKFKCDVVYFEIPIGSKSNRASQALNSVKGVVIATCILSKIKFFPVSAKKVKNQLTNDNNASKEDILKKVSQNFKSFDKKTKDLPKFKLYAVSDAAAIFLGLNINK